MSTVPLLRSICGIARGETHVEYIKCVEVYSAWQEAILLEWQRTNSPLCSVPSGSAEALMHLMVPTNPTFARCAEASAGALLWHLVARAEFHSRVYPTPIPALIVPEPN
jgi:hypothetical protein